MTYRHCFVIESAAELETTKLGPRRFCRRLSLYDILIAVERNHFFGNSSGKSEQKTSAQVTRFTANYWRPSPNGRKMAAKKPHSECELFCHRNNAWFTPLPAGGRFLFRGF